MPDDDDGQHEPTRSSHACPYCGHAEVEGLDSTEEYCASCGAVLSDVGFQHTNATHTADPTVYIRHSDARYNAQATSSRLSHRWNQAKLHQAHTRLHALCSRLGLQGQRERAQHLLDAYFERVAQETAARQKVFGRTDELAAACAYVAAAEDGGGRPGCALGQVAGRLGISVFALGASVNCVCRRLHVPLPQADALLRVLQGADVLGSMAREQDDERARTLGMVAGRERAAQGVGALVLALLADQAEARRVARAAQGAYVFCTADGRHAGFSPATVAGSALALALEHVAVQADGWGGRGMQKCQRAVVERLAGLAVGCGATSIQRFSLGVRRELCRVGGAAPGLRGRRLTPSDACVFLEDVVWFYQAARGVAGGALPEDARRAVEAAGVPGAFARAENRRVRRSAMVGGPAGGGREAGAVGALAGDGAVDPGAVLSLPDLGSMRGRERVRGEAERRRLDGEHVDAADMSEAEAYKIMLHFRLLLVCAVLAVLLALVQGAPAGEANAPAASAAAAAPLASPSIDIVVTSNAPTHASAVVASSDGPAAHLSLGQVVFNFVAGMLNIVEDTVRGYMQFGPSHN
ncbi:hypothetical protein GGI15_004041 [Coemansia interrupta]|uniref:TFIIB-type domain-containing protein n=1 Tax=Coemansia interrupta TaxID=1126814 RepID=A0A9W8LH29_9FUNG|nr:hypothetical protein GGI15_004041 [Coemansia interrupta]